MCVSTWLRQPRLAAAGNEQLASSHGVLLQGPAPHGLYNNHYHLASRCTGMRGLVNVLQEAEHDAEEDDPELNAMWESFFPAQVALTVVQVGVGSCRENKIFYLV